MKEFLRLLKTEFIKNTNLKNIIITLSILIISSIVIFKLPELTFNSMSKHEWHITKESIEEDEILYNKYKDLLKESNTEEVYINLIKKQKQIELDKLMYDNNYTSDKSNMGDLYDKAKNIINELVEHELIIDGYRETNDLDNIKREYQILKEQYDKILEVIISGNVYEIEEFYLKQYKSELNNINKLLENTKEKDYNLENKKYYFEQKIYLSQYIIDNKVTTNNWQYIVVLNSERLVSNLLFPIPTLEEFNNSREHYSQYNNYEDLVNSYLLGTFKDRKQEYLLYKECLENNIRPLVDSSSFASFHNEYDIRICFNNIYYTGIVVVIICIVLFSGIVAKEHNTGSIRLVLSNPFKRGKVLLSKFIYIILNALILYIISLLIFIVIMFITGNGDSLSIPQLIIEEGSITTTNYLLFVIKNMGIHFIFIIFVLAILFFISSISLNVALTSGITLIIVLLSTFLPVIAIDPISKVFNYIPLTFINYSNYILNNPMYNLFINKDIYCNLDLMTSIITSIIFTIIIIIITNIIYKKRDIKN
ncbi:MAG: ABC transporter permease [Clostridium sp.]|nr:ABC transporter permease [Clostridium sp.]MCM1443985.1 ABC transporter permease [Candidatus Amulumruptor caecigallinarius]